MAMWGAWCRKVAVRADRHARRYRRAMDITARSYVGGEWIAGSGAPFRSVNPATGEEFGPQFFDAGHDKIDRALIGADAAFRTYASSSLAQRATFLRAIADELTALGEPLLTIAHLETALPLDRLARERMRTVQTLHAFADYVEDGSWLDARIDTAEPARVPAPRPDIRRLLVPLGPIVNFAASNFPLAFSVAGGDTASAFAAGCSVVCKAHEAHPGTSELAAMAIVRAAATAGVPPAVFSLLHGRSHEVGLSLVRHPLTRAVSFTGSPRAGRILFDEGGAREEPIPVYAEMGSINPMFVLPGALASRPEALADGIASSMLLGVGQFCTSPGLVIAVRGEGFDRLQSGLASRIATAAPGTMLRATMRTSFRDAVYLARKHGAEQVAVGVDAGTAEGHTVQPVFLTVKAPVLLADQSLQHEMFGPVTMLVICDSVDEMLRVAKALEGQLTASLHGTDAELAHQHALVRVLQHKAGRLIVNGYPTGVEFGHAIHHGGPFPATTDSRSTSVGSAAIARFTRPVCYQDFPQTLLPAPLRDANDAAIWRMVNGTMTRAAIT